MKRNNWPFYVSIVCGVISLGCAITLLFLLLPKTPDKAPLDITPTPVPTSTQESLVERFMALEAYADTLSKRVSAIESRTPTPAPTLEPTATPVIEHSIEVTSNSVRYSPENISIELTDGYVFDDELIGSGMLTLADVKHSRVVYVHLDKLDQLDISDAVFNGRDYSWVVESDDLFAKRSYVISENYVITIYMPLDIWHDDIERSLDTIWMAMEVVHG